MPRNQPGIGESVVTQAWCPQSYSNRHQAALRNDDRPIPARRSGSLNNPGAGPCSVPATRPNRTRPGCPYRNQVPKEPKPQAMIAISGEPPIGQAFSNTIRDQKIASQAESRVRFPSSAPYHPRSSGAPSLFNVGSLSRSRESSQFFKSGGSSDETARLADGAFCS